MLRKVRRGVASMPKDHCGFSIMSRMFGRVSLGGVVSPFFRSLWRWPMICRSSVRTRAEQFALRARSIRASTKSSSRMT